MLILFLNELSADRSELEFSDARERVLSLLRVLRLIRKQQQQVGINSSSLLKDTLVDQRYSIAELLSGDEYRDEWRFLRGFLNRSPLASGMEATFDIQMGEVDYHYQEEPCVALGWADLLGTGVVSFLDTQFDGEWLTVNKNELDSDAEIKESAVQVRNFSTLEHIEIHSDWLRTVSFEWLTETGALWQQREILFPNLRFLNRSRSDLDSLRVSGACYLLVLRRLNELNQDIASWVEQGTSWPEFSSHATPEGQSRRRLCKVMDGGEEHYFDWHLRFTGGIAGRIHFRICPQEQRAVIAYLGRKLDAPIVQ